MRTKPQGAFNTRNLRRPLSLLRLAGGLSALLLLSACSISLF